MLELLASDFDIFGFEVMPIPNVRAERWTLEPTARAHIDQHLRNSGNFAAFETDGRPQDWSGDP